VRELDPVDGRRVLIAETLDDAQPFVAACRQRLAGQGPDPDFVGAHVSPWAATATFAVREADGRYAVSCETTPDEPLVPSSESRTPWNDDEALDAAGGGLAWAGDADVAFVWVVPASGTTRVLVDQRTYYLAYEAHRRGPIRVAVYGREQRSDDLVVRVVFVDARGVEIGEREVRAAVAG
jgi:hypothetical protein